MCFYLSLENRQLDRDRTTASSFNKTQIACDIIEVRAAGVSSALRASRLDESAQVHFKLYTRASKMTMVEYGLGSRWMLSLPTN